MSHTAVVTREIPRVEPGMLRNRFLDAETIEAPPEPIPVDIDVKITGPDSVAFSLQRPVDGVLIPPFNPSTIHVSRSNASLDLVLHLDPASGFSFESPAILWIKPPQRGYETDPFGTAPVDSPDGFTATIQNFTTGLPPKEPLRTRFALILKNDLNNHTVVIDPTIVDEPNT